MNKIELNISSSALSHANCMLELYRTIVLGYKEPHPPSSMIYGVAVHRYRDVMFKTKGNIPMARDAALQSFKVPKEDDRKRQHLSDERHMMTTAFNYWEMYITKDSGFDIIDLNGIPATELTFSIPYIENDYFKVNLCGTIDGLGKIKGGGYSIQDLKTTSAWDQWNFFKKYELSKQLRFYYFVLRLMSQMYPDSVLGKIGATKVGAFIDALFIKPSPSDNVYARSEVFQFSEEHMAEFKVSLDRLLERIMTAFMNPELLTKDGILIGACEKGYGKLCTFFNVCACQDDKVGQVLLNRDFVVKPFDPLHYND